MATDTPDSCAANARSTNTTDASHPGLARVTEHATVSSYAMAARAFLLAREDLCGLSLGALSALERDESPFHERHLFTFHADSTPSDTNDGARDGTHDPTLGTCHWTPPQPLSLSPMTPLAIEALVSLLVATDRRPNALRGESDDVDAFERAWAARLPAAPLVREHAKEQGLYRLDSLAVDAPPAEKGALRMATRADRDLMRSWSMAFEVECDLGRPREAVWKGADAAVDSGARYVLEVAGRPVAMAGIVGRTPNSARVGSVYTPPEHRGRGHASTVVSLLTAELLAAGARFCTLYTDLANPTCNAIYQRLGYARIGTARYVRFVAPA